MALQDRHPNGVIPVNINSGGNPRLSPTLPLSLMGNHRIQVLTIPPTPLLRRLIRRPIPRMLLRRPLHMVTLLHRALPLNTARVRPRMVSLLGRNKPTSLIANRRSSCLLAQFASSPAPDLSAFWCRRSLKLPVPVFSLYRSAQGTVDRNQLCGPTECAEGMHQRCDQYVKLFDSAIRLQARRHGHSH